MKLRNPVVLAQISNPNRSAGRHLSKRHQLEKRMDKIESSVYIIHIKLPGGEWTPLAKTGSPPYSYSTPKRAWEIAEICYPELCRGMRLYGDEKVRVTKISPDKYSELFGAEPIPAEL